MFYEIPEFLFRDFEEVSGRNFSNRDTKHIETLAYIIGEDKESEHKIIANGLLYPDQDGYPYQVTSKDTIDGIDVHEKLGHGKKIIGWIHSHVRKEKCFFSGLDVHTQYTSQKSNSNFLGVVMQISKIGQYEDHKVYKLTDRRMKVVNDCLQNHKGHAPCGRNDFELLYQSMSSSVTLILELSLTTNIGNGYIAIIAQESTYT